MFENQVIVSLINIFSLLIILFMLYNNSTINKIKKKYFGMVIICTVFVILSEIFSNIVEHNIIKSSVLLNISNVIGFSLSPFIALIICYAFVQTKKKRLIYVTFMAALNLFLVFLSPFTGWIFSIKGTDYSRGKIFFFYVICYVITLVTLFIIILNSIILKYGRQKIIAIIMYVFTMIGTSIQVIYPHIHTTWICITFSILVYYSVMCENMSNIDNLTGLYNRAAYETAIKHFNKKGSGIVIIFDIDNFKKINDTEGHAYGDYALSEIGNIIKKTFNDIGFGYRIGGDEFCVICENTPDFLVEKQIEKFINSVINVRNKSIRFPSVSYGYCCFSSENEGISKALKVADQNMYEFKNNRKISLLNNEID